MSIWAVNSLSPIIPCGNLFHMSVMDIPVFLCVICAGIKPGLTHARQAFRHSAMAPDPLFFYFWICTWGVRSISAVSRTNYALDEWALVYQWCHSFSLGSSGAKWRGTLLYDLIFSLNTFWVCTSCAAPSSCPSIVWFTIQQGSRKQHTWVKVRDVCKDSTRVESNQAHLRYPAACAQPGEFLPEHELGETCIACRPPEDGTIL